jgi:hypothetical protein
MFEQTDLMLNTDSVCSNISYESFKKNTYGYAKFLLWLLWSQKLLSYINQALRKYTSCFGSKS